MLAHPLSEDEAVRLAILNNHDLQAQLSELGIARAQVIQAGMIPDPTLMLMPRFPDKPPSGVDFEISVEGDLISLLALPARKKLAKAQYKQAVLKTADAVVDLAARTRAAYCKAAAARFVADLHQHAYDGAGRGSTRDKTA